MKRGARSSKPPLCELVRFEAADGVMLAGLLYEARRSTNAIAWLHGMGGSVFESKRTNELARAFTARGFAFFPFNNRGARGGMAHEQIRDCVPDIDGAIRELRRRGYTDITLAGHSTGANKIAVYDHYQPRNRAKRYVFLAGGDDTGLLYSSLGSRRFHAALAKARTMIHERRGDEIVPRAISPMMLSWRSFYDMANPNGDYNVFPFLEATRGPRLSRRPLFRHLRAIRKPSLYVLGDRDEFCGEVSAAAALLARHASAKAEIVVMRDADHGFSDHEAELGELIVRWID